MTLDDVPEMLAAWRKGELQLDDVYYLCLNLLVVNAVEGVLATLPQELRGQFESKLAAEFDNDIPAGQYMFLESGRGDNPDKVSIINEVRAYVARVAARERAGGDAATSQRFDGVIAITYAIGSEFAPDDPFGREVVELTAGGRLSYSRRLHGNASAKVRSYAPGRFAALLADLERTSFPTPQQRAFRPGPGPATISTRAVRRVGVHRHGRRRGHRRLSRAGREVRGPATATSERRPEPGGGLGRDADRLGRVACRERGLRGCRTLAGRALVRPRWLAAAGRDVCPRSQRGRGGADDPLADLAVSPQRSLGRVRGWRPAMDKDTRNAIERATQRARKLLEDDFASQLEGDFDVLRAARWPKAGKHLSPRQVFQRDKIVAAIEHKRAAGMSAATPSPTTCATLRSRRSTASSRSRCSRPASWCRSASRRASSPPATASSAAWRRVAASAGKQRATASTSSASSTSCRPR
jgi:hypothetical protein